MGLMQLRVRDALNSFVVAARLSLEGRTRYLHGKAAELCTHVSTLVLSQRCGIRPHMAHGLATRLYCVSTVGACCTVLRDLLSVQGAQPC